MVGVRIAARAWWAVGTPSYPNWQRGRNEGPFSEGSNPSEGIQFVRAVVVQQSESRPATPGTRVRIPLTASVSFRAPVV